MNKFVASFLIVITLLSTTVFAHDIEEISFNCEQLGYDCFENALADEYCYAGSDCAEGIYYCPEELPKTYPATGMELMSSGDTLAQTLIQGWENLQESINIREYNIPRSGIGDAYRGVLYSNPIYYYVKSGFSYSYTWDGYIASVLPNYTCTDKNEINATIAEIEKATDEILFYIDPGMSDVEKIMTVHDYMIFHYDYDTVSEEPNRNLLIMTEKKGVCMAYTFAFTHLMNKLGIETRYVSSEEMNHAWNLVNVNREWFHIDLTWDDPVYKNPEISPHYRACHKYALLSDDKISSMDNPHYGYNLGELSATSHMYDDALWHDGTSAIVTIDDNSFWVEGNNIVCEHGDIIYENLDGGDSFWNASEFRGWSDTVYGGVAGYNSKLYFNTDNGIYSYNPETKSTELVHSEYGITGMSIDGNVIYYDKYDIETGTFVTESIHLENICYSHPYIENGKIIAKVYKDTDEPTKIFSSCNGCFGYTSVESSGLSVVEFDASDDAYLYFWDENLKPLREKLKVVK